nr:MAG TPA: hypothetical protein [Caudoviricetes sp.]
MATDPAGAVIVQDQSKRQPKMWLLAGGGLH